MKNKTIEVSVRAIILEKGKVLVCRPKNKRYYFFPGGHVEFGEDILTTLKREIKEEIGDRLEAASFIGVVDNFFVQDREKRHEVNMIFSGRINKANVSSREKHIVFSLLDLKTFAKSDVRPIALKKAVVKWTKDKKVFSVTQKQKAL